MTGCCGRHADPVKRTGRVGMAIMWRAGKHDNTGSDSVGNGTSDRLLIAACVFLVWAVGMLERFGHRVSGLAPAQHRGLLIGSMFATVVFSHTLQVWIWAVAFVVLGAIDGLSQSIYFALVTYTTLGYGDVTLGPIFRIFGAMSAVTGCRWPSSVIAGRKAASSTSPVGSPGRIWPSGVR